MYEQLSFAQKAEHIQLFPQNETTIPFLYFNFRTESQLNSHSLKNVKLFIRDSGTSKIRRIWPFRYVVLEEDSKEMYQYL